MLDTRFEYLREVAAKYGVDQIRVDNGGRSLDVHRFIHALGPDQLQELAEAYYEIARREDSSLISKWTLGAMETPEQQQLFLLFCLFQRLGDYGFEPFNTREVKLVEKKPKLDWNKLPKQIAFLAQPAQKYGAIQFDDEVYQFLTALDADTYRELRHVSDLAKDCQTEIDGFLDKYSMAEHPEAARVYFLMLLLDSLPDKKEWDQNAK